MIAGTCICGVAIVILLAAVLVWLFTTDPFRRPYARRCRDGKSHEWGPWKLHGYTYNQRTCTKCNYTVTE